MLGWPRWAVNRRAQALGLSKIKERQWTPEEEEYLQTRFHRMRVGLLAKKLGRSKIAIRLKAKRLQIRKKGEGYTARSLAEALGIDPHWVTRRIKAGSLHASLRQTERTSKQGGDEYYISEQAVIDFIKRYPFEIDLRKVDQLWFLEMIADYLNGRL